jgi:type I restriction enzyme S subunit
MQLCDELEAQQQAQRESRVRLNTAILAPLNRAASLRPEEIEQSTARLADNFDTLYDSIDTVSKLRATILQLAVQGKLVAQSLNDEPTPVLLQRLEQERRSILGTQRHSRIASAPLESNDFPFQIPSSWRWTRLGELTQLIEYGTSEKATLNEDGVPVLRMNNIDGGKVHISQLKYVSPSIKDLPRLYLRTNELLFNRTNSFELVGKTGIFKGGSDKCTFASYLIRIRLHEAYIFPDFVNLAMNADYFRTTQINTNVTQQCGQANFNGTKLANTLIPLPPLAEQKRVVSKVNRLMSLCDELEAKLRQAEADSEKLMNAAVKHVLDSVRDASKTEEVFA